MESWAERAGLGELAWLDSSGAPPTRLLVVVAHPDDETLVAGGLIHLCASRPIPMTVVVATAGEASHPGSPTLDPDQLAARRRNELAEALRHLHPKPRWRVLGLPDGGLSDREARLAALIAAEITASTLVVSLWRHDGHPDHEAVGRATARACRPSGARHLEAPLWAWVWRGATELPWEDALRLSLSPAARAAKEAAAAAYTSQTRPLSPDPADAAVVAPDVVDHFLGPVEVFLEQPVGPSPQEVFDRVWGEGPDPWRFEGSWYEERKRQLTMAALPRQDAGRVLELGPADGRLTALLADRARSLLAVEVSAPAAQAALDRLRSAGLVDRVEVRVGRVPHDLPPPAEGPFDTVVVSELAYFLTAQEWSHTVRRLTDLLAPEGCLVLVHWMHRMDGWPLSAEAAHDIAESVSGLSTVVHHAEPDFELRVLQSPAAPSVAEADGRL